MIRLYSIILFHHLVVFAALFAAIGSFFTASLPVAIGIAILVLRMGTSGAPCILTKLENRYRRELGLPQIKGFIGHYYLGKK